MECRGKETFRDEVLKERDGMMDCRKIRREGELWRGKR